MKAAAIAMALLLAGPTGLAAEMALDCTKTEQGQFIAARDRAAGLALTATSAIGAHPAYTRWFGTYNAKSAEQVRRNLKAVVKVLRDGSVTAQCRNVGEGLCDGDTYAFVDKDDLYVVNLCPNFFDMATMKQLTAATVRNGNGTRAGTLIHEISHFADVADTVDICYSRLDCADLARSAPEDTVRNADSYQYFVEDVTYFGDPLE